MSEVMTSVSAESRRSKSGADELLLDYRERRALEELERAAEKRHDKEKQCCAENSAEMRIQAWEKVHQLRMPSSPSHPVLRAIAAATQLSLAEVLHEQQLRASRRASAVL